MGPSTFDCKPRIWVQVRFLFGFCPVDDGAGKQEPFKILVISLTAELYYAWSSNIKLSLQSKEFCKLVEAWIVRQGSVELQNFLNKVKAQERSLALAYDLTSVHSNCNSLVW